MDKNYNFTAIIEPCEEGGYYGECPSLPGCHAQGETYEETLKELRAVVCDMIEEYQKSGEEIPSDEKSSLGRVSLLSGLKWTH